MKIPNGTQKMVTFCGTQILYLMVRLHGSKFKMIYIDGPNMNQNSLWTNELSQLKKFHVGKPVFMTKKGSK